MALSISLSNWLIFCIALQDEKNQLLITNMWLKMVRLLFIFCSLFSCVINQSGVLTNGFHFFSPSRYTCDGCVCLVELVSCKSVELLFCAVQPSVESMHFQCRSEIRLTFTWRIVTGRRGRKKIVYFTLRPEISIHFTFPSSGNLWNFSLEFFVNISSLINNI